MTSQYTSITLCLKFNKIELSDNFTFFCLSLVFTVVVYLLLNYSQCRKYFLSTANSLVFGEYLNMFTLDLRYLDTISLHVFNLFSRK